MRAPPTIRLPTALLAASALLAAACGDSKEEDRFERVQEVCDTFVGRPLGDWVEELGGMASNPSRVGCRTDLQPMNERDACPYDGETEICDGKGWNFFANDESLCGSGACVPQPDGSCRPVRCWYGCLVRYRAADVVVSTKQEDRNSLVICGAGFVSREAVPPAR